MYQNEFQLRQFQNQVTFNIPSECLFDSEKLRPMLGHKTIVHTSVPVINSPRIGIFFMPLTTVVMEIFCQPQTPNLQVLTLGFISFFAYRQRFFKSTLVSQYKATLPARVVIFLSQNLKSSVPLLANVKCTQYICFVNINFTTQCCISMYFCVPVTFHFSTKSCWDPLEDV